MIVAERIEGLFRVCAEMPRGLIFMHAYLFTRLCLQAAIEYFFTRILCLCFFF